MMDIAHIREMFRQGHFGFYFHAFQEALKDGITGDDILYVIEHGEIIEEYVERSRCLIFASVDDMPLHVVIDYSCEDELQVVTTYVPDRREWTAYRKRRGRNEMSQKTCPLCQSEMIWERRTICYERESVPITLENVWVRVCSACGHELVPGPVAIQLLNLAEQLFRSAQQLQAITHLPPPQISFSFPETEAVPDALLSLA